MLCALPTEYNYKGTETNASKKSTFALEASEQRSVDEVVSTKDDNEALKNLKHQKDPNQKLAPRQLNHENTCFQ